MRLKDFMAEAGLDDGAMADLINQASDLKEKATTKSVQNWRYGYRRPRLEMMLRIASVTSHKVTVSDWAASAAPEAA